MKAQGAEVVDIAVPGLDDLLRDSSVIADEFKFDLMAYLAKHPNAPVKSLGEVIERGLHHDALDANFRLRNAPGEARDRTLPPGDDQAARRPGRGARHARRTAHRRARLPDAAPQAGADRRPAGRQQLPVERDHGIAGDLDSRRVHHRWPPDRSRVARRRVDGSHAAEIRLRVGAGHQATPRAVQHAAAGERRGAGAGTLRTSRSAPPR